MEHYPDLNRTKAFTEIGKLKKVFLREVLTPERLKGFSIPAGGGLTYNYSAMPVDSEIIGKLQDLAGEQKLIEQYRLLLQGEVMNTGESRKVLHHLTRGEPAGLVPDTLPDSPGSPNSHNPGEFYRDQLEKTVHFAEKVHAGEIKGSTGKPFSTVVQIGIGGSDLGPRALYSALETYAKAEGKLKLKAEFISNVDPDDAAGVLDRINPETTLFILVSKSGTTQETLANRELVIRRMRSLTPGTSAGSANNGIPGIDPGKHMVAVTSDASPLAESPDYLESFYIDDYIGGRYSSTSPVGGVLLSLAFGPQVFQELLQGAHDADKKALETDIKKNPSLMDALIGVYLRNCLGYPAVAVLPYSQGLHRFPAHLQQLDMESNGKQTTRRGETVGYQTGPVVFGEPGTNGQHSFYQLLHQGTDIIPLQFIGFTRCQSGEDVSIDGSSNQQKLNANLAAQIIAFALGKEHDDLNKQFPGERPSSLIHGDRLTPQALGALLAHYENKVMFQGFCWNINSFDQEGVQLGKVLTKQVLDRGPSTSDSLTRKALTQESEGREAASGAAKMETEAEPPSGPGGEPGAETKDGENQSRRLLLQLADILGI